MLCLACISLKKSVLQFKMQNQYHTVSSSQLCAGSRMTAALYVGTYLGSNLPSTTTTYTASCWLQTENQSF